MTQLYDTIEYALVHTEMLFLQIVFAQVAGPLTWSIVALRNSLVLHSLDKVLPYGHSAVSNA